MLVKASYFIRLKSCVYIYIYIKKREEKELTINIVFIMCLTNAHC